MEGQLEKEAIRIFKYCGRFGNVGKEWSKGDVII